MDNEKLVLIIFGLIYLPIFVYEFFVYIKNIESTNFNLKAFIKYNIALLLFGTFIIIILSHINFLDYEKPIPYKNIKNITFKNFRGLELFKKELYGTKYFAYVVTSIESETKDDSVIIESFFHPSQSFVYDKKSNSNHLFSHEIYHFKISEVFTRKIKKKIAELDKSKFDEITSDEINKIISDFKKEEQKFQEKYDDDTFHSYVFNKQKKYERQIDSLLYLYNKFENRKILINEKK